MIYTVQLESPVATSFRAVKAANSLDIDVEKKSKHHLSISGNLTADFRIGLIFGASGSGKTTLAKQVFGEDCLNEHIDLTRPIIDQFPEEMSYDDCAGALMGIGLTSVPCWIRPAYTLSTGQKARALAALRLASGGKTEIIVIDEWTSTVDRCVAKVMSHCIQKHARKSGKQVVLVSCHYDVFEWLNPDWVVDCNKQKYEDRRSMVGAFQRTDRLQCDIKRVGRETWRYFSKYHYLSDKLPGGKIFTFGLFSGQEQIGFQCFAGYVPGRNNLFFSNRTVIHPDYAGLGLGMLLIDETSKWMVRAGYQVKAKFSSIPLHKARQKNPNWRLRKIDNNYRKTFGAKLRSRNNAARYIVKTYSYDYVWSE